MKNFDLRGGIIFPNTLPKAFADFIKTYINHMTSKNRSWQDFDFDEYTRESEPHKKDKSYARQTAIGLQAVDGDISIKEGQQLISKYYESKTDHDSDLNLGAVPLPRI